MSATIENGSPIERSGGTSSGSALLAAVLGAVLAAAPASAVVFDFQSPAALVLDGLPSGVYVVDGVPLLVEAGAMSMEDWDVFVPFAENARLEIFTGSRQGCAPPGTPGLGIDSDIPAGTGDSCRDPRLTVFEGIRFTVPVSHEPTVLTLAQFTQGNGFGEFEVARIFLDGVFWADIPGQDSGIVAIPLPPGAHQVTLNMSINSEVAPTSSDPTTVVASLVVAARELAVGFDIKPRGCPNPLQIKSRGKVPAAILGSPAVDVRAIVPAFIRVAGVPALRVSIADVATPYLPLLGKAEADDCTTAGGDGHPDLVIHVDTVALVAALEAGFGPLHDRQVVVVPLSAMLTDGTPLVGEDVLLVHRKP